VQADSDIDVAVEDRAWGLADGRDTCHIEEDDDRSLVAADAAAAVG